jgi:glycosyltransferase involved in cell wall biosynthesis
MRVLMSAYACSPLEGSEPGYGWSWPSAMAERGVEVCMITRPENSEAVEAELARQARPRLTFEYVPQSEWPLRFGRAVGSPIQYLLWQRAVARRAEELDRSQKFDLMHHVSYGSLLGGSQLWRCGRPIVFGPSGGGQTAPPALKRYFGRYWRNEALRGFAVRHLWRLFGPARSNARRSAVVLATNDETSALACRLGARIVEPMLDTGLPDDYFPESPPTRPAGDRLELLWVGRVLPRKALELCIEAVERAAADVSVHLTVVGDQYDALPVITPERRQRAAWFTDFRGTVSWAAVSDAYREADAFIFASLRESCGVQLLEAMAWGLPVITLDHQGAALLVPDGAGVKVRVSSADETLTGLADAIVHMARLSTDERAAMGAVGFTAARAQAWSQRAAAMEQVYKRVTGQRA